MNAAGPGSSGTGEAPPRVFAWVAALCLAAPILAAALTPATAGITYLWDGPLPANPYLVPEHFALLYLVAPLYSAAAVVMMLAPGMLVVMGIGGAQAEEWTGVLARGFLVSFVARVVLQSGVKAVTPLTAATFWGVEAILALGAVAFLGHRWRGGAATIPTDRLHQVLFTVAIPVVLTIVFLPQFYWQDFTEDGMESLEAGRSLTNFVVPRYPNASGFMGLGIGMLSMAPPVSWFIQMLGPVEAATRLPLLLYLPVLTAILIRLVETAGGQRVTRMMEGTILLVLGAFVVIMTFSATYDAYAADMSAPTAFETLTLLCLAGILLGLWEERRVTFFAYVLLGYFARPTALMLLLLLVPATILVFRDRVRRRMLIDVGLGIGLCIASVIVYEKIYVQWAAGGSMSWTADSVVDRYRYVSLTDVRRVLWVMIPLGFLPFLSLFALPKQDPHSRQLSLVLLAYFGAFYLPAFVALHHFVPVMVLPVVVFARWSAGQSEWYGRAGLIGAAVGVFLCLPQSFHVDRTSREIGYRMAFEIGDYGGELGADRAARNSRNAVFELFPATFDVADPSTTRVGASFPYLYYSDRRGVELEDADYAIVAESEPAPDGFFEAGRINGAVAYARDQATWNADLADAPRTDFGNSFFVIPRERLFWFVGAPAGEYDVNVSILPGIWRLFWTVDVMNTLGIIYEQGLNDVPANRDEALVWYRRAAELGHEGAQENVTRLETGAEGEPSN